jgi:phosphate transport system protein
MLESNLHRSSQFNEELERLRDDVMKMGLLIEAQIKMATQAYTQNDVSAALQVLENDDQVNQLEKAIDDECIHIIAKRQPTASDLRLIMSIGKIVTDFERMGDETKKIAKSVRNMQKPSHQAPVDMIGVRHLARMATKQLQGALHTFSTLDTAEARAVINADDTLDAELKSTVRQLITFMMEDPRTISAALEMMTMARALERVGDHTTNVAEQVIYIVEGRDVRHSSN